MSDYALKAIDRHFADFIEASAPTVSPEVKRVVSLLSNGVGNGQICIDLAEIAGREIRIDGFSHLLPALDTLRRELLTLDVVGRPGEFRPLVIDESDRLYLYRYWEYEQNLAAVIRERAAAPCFPIDRHLLAAGMGRLFPPVPGAGVDWQKIAAVAALTKQFCIISGGPGTGKTSTVVKILALLLEQAEGTLLRVALAAPTGKAAARLKDSILRVKGELSCRDEIKELIPVDVSTIHRLLGTRKNSIRFHHSPDNPLPCDVVIVDEASMVALPLMAKLVLALKPEARLILLGDRDQLASVEAGAVLGDLCGGSRREVFSPEFAGLCAKLGCGPLEPEPAGARLPLLADSLVVLKENYRFRAQSGIGAVSLAANSGEAAEALALLKSGEAPGVAWHDIPKPGELRRALAEPVCQGYSGYLQAETVEDAIRLFDRFRLLSPLRQGAYGVEEVNSLVEEILAAQGLIDPRNRWYRGRPVLITVNDYGLKLFNGDIGLTFPDPAADGSPRVFFPAPGGGVRAVSPLRLPAHETVYAMTIHKSQGSEFDHLLMLIPPQDSELLTRELVYTGITRGKSGVDVWGDEGVFTAALGRRIVRKSGLQEAVWGYTDR